MIVEDLETGEKQDEEAGGVHPMPDSDRQGMSVNAFWGIHDLLPYHQNLSILCGVFTHPTSRTCHLEEHEAEHPHHLFVG
jgi:hypothetical protein